MKITLIRHGKTPANEKKLYCGHTDISLSETGKSEIRILKEKGIYPKIEEADFFYTSEKIRTFETLQLIYGDIDSKKIAGFDEFNFGDFEMKSYELLKEEQPYIDWISDKTGEVFCLNGENKKTFERRVIKAYNELLASSHKHIVICTHGGVITTLMQHLFPEEDRNFYDWQPSCGGGYQITYEKYRSLEEKYDG